MEPSEHGGPDLATMDPYSTDVSNSMDDNDTHDAATQSAYLAMLMECGADSDSDLTPEQSIEDQPSYENPLGTYIYTTIIEIDDQKSYGH